MQAQAWAGWPKPRARSSRGIARSRATPPTGLEQHLVAGLKPGDQRLGRCLRTGDQGQPGQPLGRRRHHLALGAAIDNHQAIEPQGQGPLGDLAMQLQALLAELEHGAEHRKPPTQRGLVPSSPRARRRRTGGTWS